LIRDADHTAESDSDHLHEQAIFSQSLDDASLWSNPRRMSISPRHRWALALLGALPIIWILTASAVFGAQRPGYDATHAISELGQQGSANAVAWNVLGFGGAALLYALYSFPIAAEFGRRWLFVLVVLQMIATAASGVFSCDPGCPPVMSTPQGWLHTVFGMSYFLVLGVLPLVAWRVFRKRPEWRSLAFISLMVGLLLIACLLIGPVVLGAERIGIYQRTLLVIGGAWAALFAQRLAWRVRQHAAPPRCANHGSSFAAPQASRSAN
jgi:hypothetical protein